MNRSRISVVILKAILLLYCSCVSQPDPLPEEIQGTASLEEPVKPPADEESAYDRIGSALLLGDVGEAITAYEDVGDSESSEAQILLSRLYIIAGQVDDAQTILDSIPPEDENYVDAAMGLALVARLQNDREAERAYVQQVIAYDAEHPQANVMLGELLLEDGYYDKAEQHFLKTLEYEADNLFALQGLGNAYLRNDKTRDAIQAFSNAIDADPDFSYSYIDRAKAQASQGYYEGALADADMAIRLDAENGWHYFDRGRIHARNGSFEHAVSDFDRALIYTPENFLARASRAQMNGLLKEYDAAFEDYKRVLAVRSGYYPAYPYIGALEFINGNYPQVFDFFHKAAESVDIKDSHILFAAIGLFAESESRGKKYLNDNFHLFDKDGLMYLVGRFYTDGVDFRVLNSLEREENEEIKARAQFYLALRYLQIDGEKTAMALLASSEQSRLDGFPESLVRNWLLDETIQ